MKQLIALAAALLLLSSCGKQDPMPPPPTGGGSSGGPRPEKLANGEPAVITVQHVLIAFKGSGIEKVTRTRDEAQHLAYQVLNRAKAGEDFDKLMNEHSDDHPGGGTYTLVNTGIAKMQNESERTGMVPAFGDVGFRINVNEIAVAEHDAKTSPYGWHIIKRTK